ERPERLRRPAADHPERPDPRRRDERHGAHAGAARPAPGPGAGRQAGHPDRSDPTAVDGLRRIVPSGQTLDAATNGTALTLALLDQLLDLVRGGKPDI